MYRYEAPVVTHQQTLEILDSSTQFGSAVAINPVGDLVMVHGNDCCGADKAYLFFRASTNWQQVEVFEPSDNPSGSFTYGEALAMSENHIVIGDRNQNAVYVYDQGCNRIVFGDDFE